MKRRKVLLVLLVVVLIAGIAQAQQRSPNPQGQQPQPDSERRAVRVQSLPVVGNNVLDLVGVLGGVGGAWWTNTALVTRLGLTDDQKGRLQRAFENHRLNLESSKASLEKEEAQLGRLLEAESIDRTAILSQIDRVTQARSELERTNSVMTLEMREVLTRTQWTQLPQTSLQTFRFIAPGDILNNGGAVAPGQRGGGARGQRQQ